MLLVCLVRTIRQRFQYGTDIFPLEPLFVSPIGTRLKLFCCSALQKAMSEKRLKAPKHSFHRYCTCDLQGHPVDGKPRHEAGIHLHPHWMKMYLETGQARNISKLFVDITSLRADTPEKYTKISNQLRKYLIEFDI